MLGLDKYPILVPSVRPYMVMVSRAVILVAAQDVVRELRVDGYRSASPFGAGISYFLETDVQTVRRSYALRYPDKVGQGCSHNH